MTKKPTILCIDDRPMNLRVRTMLLEQFGCNTIAVEDYRSALRVVTERDDVDLLVIDYHLANGETGEDIARDVRNMRPQIPLIMLTGDIRLPESACRSVDAVLIKGVSNPTALLDLIEKLLPNTTILPRHDPIFCDEADKAS
jgi:CheY-like chemotaxis protein